MSSLTSFTISAAKAAIRRRHPEFDESAVLVKFIELHHGKELAEKLRAYLDSAAG